MMFGRRPAGRQEFEQRHFQPFGGNRVRFHESVVDEIGDACNPHPHLITHNLSATITAQTAVPTL